jgi:hypothetical protein
VTILGDSTQELTTTVTDMLQDELGMTTTSFSPIGTVVGGGTTEVAIGITHVVEEKTMHTLLLIFLLFLFLYYSHNMNT